jgi:hypothetical protein
MLKKIAYSVVLLMAFAQLVQATDSPCIYIEL